jgi:hypothetical protein
MYKNVCIFFVVGLLIYFFLLHNKCLEGLEETCQQSIDKEMQDQIVENAGKIKAIGEKISVILSNVDKIKPGVEDNAAQNEQNKKNLQRIAKDLQKKAMEQEAELDKLEIK